MSKGEMLKRKGSQLLWERNQVWIDGCKWFSHYDGKGGYAVSFVMKYFGLKFQDAMQELTGVSMDIKPIDIHIEKASVSHELVQPTKSDTLRHVFAYLIQTRGIAPDVVTGFVRNRLIYEDAEHHNAVFVGKDETGVARHLHCRGIGSETFKQTIAGSDPRYSFHYIGTGERIYVFEAPIDMLAFISLHPSHWQNNSYVALCGVAEHALLHQLEVNPKLHKISLCLDNDDAGHKAEQRISSILCSKGYTDIEILTPVLKDWDEDLIAARQPKHELEMRLG